MADRPIVGKLQFDAQSLTERAIQAVRSAIRNGQMVPGELYTVNQLAVELGVSRSPVRDALLRLEETGVIKFERNRGFRLTLPTSVDLAQIFSVRLALEVPATAVATQRATPAQLEVIEAERAALYQAAQDDDEPTFMLHDQRLHSAVLDIADNAFIRKIIDNIRDATRLVGASTIENYRTLVEVYEEHLPIIEGIIAKDPTRAAEAMRYHLSQTARLLIQKSLEGGDADRVDEIWDAAVGSGYFGRV